MSGKLIFVDSGVLITAARGQDLVLRARALAVLRDPQHLFASSAFVRLEVMPKAIWSGNRTELDFYEAFFNVVSAWPADNEAVIRQAHCEAAVCGLGTVDALHVSATVLLGAAELVTIEKPTKSIHCTRSIKVVSLR